MSRLILLFNHRPTMAQEQDARQSLGIDEIILPPAHIQVIWSQVPADTETLGSYLTSVHAWLAAAARSRGYRFMVRMEALAALRRLSPTEADRVTEELTKRGWSNADIKELESVIVGNAMTGARCEALMLLAAAGKTSALRSRLQKKLASKNISDAERSNIKYALRLVTGFGAARRVGGGAQKQTLEKKGL